MKILKPILILGLLFIVQNSNGQATINLQVGEWLTIGECKKGSQNFNFIDEYARTLPLDTSKIDRITGDGLMEAFFSDKSIDAHRLPCLHAGKRYQIAAFHTFEIEDPANKNKKIEQNVMLLYSGYAQTLFWVMLEDALSSQEIVIR